MAIREGFDIAKFREQALRFAQKSPLIKDKNDAEDFAQFCCERFLKYKHYQPMRWLTATFYRTRRKESLSTDLVEPTIEISEPESHTFISSEIFETLLKTQSKHGAEKLSNKTHHFYTNNWQAFKEAMHPIQVNHGIL